MLRVVRGAVTPGLCLIGVFKDALLEGDEFPCDDSAECFGITFSCKTLQLRDQDREQSDQEQSPTSRLSS